MAVLVGVNVAPVIGIGSSNCKKMYSGFNAARRGIKDSLPRRQDGQQWQRQYRRHWTFWRRIGGAEAWSSWVDVATGGLGKRKGSTPPNVTGEEVPATSSPPTEEAYSDDSSSGRLDLDDQPAHQGPPHTRYPGTVSHHHRASPLRKHHNSTHPAGPYLCPQDTSVSSVSTTTGTPGHPTNTGQSGTWGQWQRAHGSGDRGNGQQGSWKDCCASVGGQAQVTDSPRGSHSDLGAYQHSQETLGQILGKMQENMRLQEGQYPGIREDLKSINTTLVSIAGVLADMANSIREAVAQQRAPDTSQTTEQPSTSACGQEAPPQDQQATSTPPSAEGDTPQTFPAIQAEARGY
ncbi:uncharacterized protein [Pleurodeles waltl]|uniref:uncharacterized protein n=1 Tax=Pleurodeles waltl TaxID=8319 RepID=UPI0037093871